MMPLDRIDTRNGFAGHDPLPTAGFDLERLDLESRSAYWLRFLNGHWLVYWHERLIGDFPAEKAASALALLRQKQGDHATPRNTRSRR